MKKVKLQNFGKFFGVYLVMLFFLMVSIVSLVSCYQQSSQNVDETVVDSVYVSTTDAYEDPLFNSILEVKTFQNDLIEEYSIEETFRTMPEEVLINVASVCLKRDGIATMHDIVLEYRANCNIYNNLSNTITPNTVTSNQNTATEEQQLPAPASVSYHYEIDTVNEKPTKVLVKEERYEGE